MAARLELLNIEKDFTQRGDDLARRRQALPWVRIDKEYRFDTDEGSASLADLFRGRSQLLIYHFMFGPDYTAGCPSCSAIADGFNGFIVHLENHDVAFSAVSRAPLAKLQAYKRRIVWTFPWASSFAIRSPVEPEGAVRGRLDVDLSLESYAFQACAIDHSAISPSLESYTCSRLTVQRFPDCDTSPNLLRTLTATRSAPPSTFAAR